MRVRVIALVVAMLVPATVAAQPIQNHPQKAAYATPLEWPVVSSQIHWRAPGTGGLAGVSSHTHMDCQFPLYARLGASPFTVSCSWTLFNTAGAITRISGDGKVVLDGGRTPPLAGNPTGVVTYTGTVTFDPRWKQSIGQAPAHGWYVWDLQAITTYDNGDVVPNDLRLPVFSVIDTAQPENSSAIRHHSLGRVIDADEPDVFRWGLNITEVSQLLPILGPISAEAPWRVEVKGYSYAGVGDPLDDGVMELWLDPDLHNGNPGTLLASGSISSGVNMVYDFPGRIPEGTHKVMYMWRKATFDNLKELSSNLVLPILVGPGGAAPPPEIVPPPPPPSEEGHAPPPTEPPPSEGDGHTDPPPSEPPPSPVAALTVSPSAPSAGQPYTVTATVDLTSGNVKRPHLDGIGNGFTCSATACTASATYTRAAGTYTHTVETYRVTDNSPWPPVTVTVVVR